ncbi:MAG TPA: ABC transporter ATP-binding protein [Chloroflexia bacterium]|nr:ABC transporter ATP-binding protein [Chloroflexia bacterium]
MPYTVETRQLSKHYGQFTAVNDVSMQIEPGAIFGFIGPNGAGKTTTMRMLATLLEPTSGEAWVCGLNVNDRHVDNLVALRACIGYMPDFIGIYDKMTAKEYLEFYAASYYIDMKRRPKLVTELLELVDLSSKRDTYIENLSRGMTQRLALARTLVHDPRLLLLDEPASGLDPRARVELRELLKELSRMGKTIIISSHILTELTEMCSHIGIIERGNMLASGKVSDILKALNQHTRVIRLKLGALPAELLPALEKVLHSGPGVKNARRIEESMDWELQFEGDEREMHLLLRYLIQKNVPVYSFSEQVSNLEDIFLQITKGYVS